MGSSLGFGKEHIYSLFWGCIYSFFLFHIHFSLYISHTGIHFLSSGSVSVSFSISVSFNATPALSFSLCPALLGSQENKHKIDSAVWMHREAFGVSSEETLLWLRRMMAHSIKPWWLLCFQSCRLYRAICRCTEFKDGVRPWIDITTLSEINYTLCVSVKTCDE